jgi:hemoglobin/transferrin/lactoferrin receptor protein
MKRMRISYFVMLFLVNSWFACAQEEVPAFFRLDENDLEARSDSAMSEVLAASRSLKLLEDIPVTVFIISREEILGNGYTTLVEALSSLPGIRVSMPGSAIDGEGFQIRGMYGNYYCNILVDGMTIKPSAVSGMPVGQQLPVKQAERIEVIFGPASSVYGGEAMAGVINIVTHTSDRPVTAQADIALGSEGHEYLNVMIGGKIGKSKNVFSYALYGGNSIHRDMNVKYDRGYLYNPSLYDSSYSFLDKPYFEGDSGSITMERMPNSSRTLGASFQWKGLRAEALGMSRSTHSSIGRDPSVFSYSNPQNTWAESIWRYRLSFGKKWKKISSESNLVWLNYRLDNQSTFGLLEQVGMSGSAYKYAASDDLIIEEQLTLVPISGLELAGGILYQVSGNLPLTNNLASPFKTDNYSPFSTDEITDTSAFKGFGINPVTFTKAGAYIQFFYQLNRFTFFGGYRMDYHSWYNLSHNPRLSVMYRNAKDLSLRASFSTGYREPSAYFTYFSLAEKSDEGLYYSVVPNTDLKPEKMIAAEAGIRWDRLKWFEADASLFYHRIFEQFTLSFIKLDSAGFPGAINPLMISRAYVNDENSLAELFGLQVDLGFKNIIPVIKLRTDLNITLSKGNEILPNDLGRIDNYRQMPEILGQLNFSLWPHERIRLFIRNNFSSGWVRGYLPLDPDLLRKIGYPVDISGYYSLDLQARFIIGKNFEAYTQFNNITNAHYGGMDAYSSKNDLFYNPQYGFNFRAGFNFRME